jgi:uncharacterized damage-inducible protein DinB
MKRPGRASSTPSRTLGREDVVMITVEHVQTMAHYNKWQNENHYATAAQISDEERKRDRGAFFGSIHGTLNHLVWADQQWMSRFAGTAKPKEGIPESLGRYAWEDLKRIRVDFDSVIISWADELHPDWLTGDLTWFSSSIGREITRAKGLLVTHFFNHQTHHRGQVHCMLTQCGLRPGDTDLPIMQK